MDQLDTLVVLDGSTRHLGSLTFGFEREGYHVVSTASTEEVFDQIKGQAQLLVVALGTPERGEMAHLTTIAKLREQEETRDLPIVVLGDQSARGEALRAGADEFVRWPAFIRDVVTLCKLAVALRGTDGRAIEGLVEDYGLYFLIRALSIVGRSGILELERPGRHGEMHFSRGEVVSARVGLLTGAHAFYHLLLWGEARMRFRLESPTGERKINVAIDQMLATGAEFAREFERLADKMGGPQAVFTETSKAVALKSQIPNEVFAFLRYLDGHRSVVDVVEDSPFKPFDTLKVIYRLLGLQAIAQVDVPRRVDAARSVLPLTAQLATCDPILGFKEETSHSAITGAARRDVDAPAPPAAAETSDLLLAVEAPLSKLIFNVPTAPKLSRRKDKKRKHHRPDSTAEDSRPTRDAAEMVSDSSATIEPPLDSSAVLISGVSEAQPLAPRPPFEPVPAPAGLATKLAPERAAETPTKETLLFDELEESFFASGSEVQKLEPAESFDDLDGKSAKKSVIKRNRWSLFRPSNRGR